VRWYSSNGEYAFFAVGSVARGVIAMGGVAHGVVAIGGFVSVGVISIGMNAIGSVLAVGMNAVGPVALSLINALGFFVLAGVNGWGAWTRAGTNAAGLSASGGVNSDLSIVPAVIVILLGVVLSSVFHGRRQRRKGPNAISLQAFLRDSSTTEALVITGLSHVPDDGVALAERGEVVSCRADSAVIEQARRVAAGAVTDPVRVLALLSRSEEEVPDASAPEGGYRERVRQTRRSVVLCSSVEPAPPEETWLPKDTEEMQWVVAWSTRAAVVAMLAAWVLR